MTSRHAVDVLAEGWTARDLSGRDLGRKVEIEGRRGELVDVKHSHGIPSVVIGINTGVYWSWHTVSPDTPVVFEEETCRNRSTAPLVSER